MNKDEFFMSEALKEAEKAERKGEVPVGAVCVYNGKIISRAHNLKEIEKNPIYHAEMIVINKAAKRLKRWRLTDTTLYVTLEPCYMCAGAIISSRIKRVVFGAYDKKIGAFTKKLNILKNKNLNHKLELHSGILKKECSLMLKNFFKKRRGL